MKIVSLETYTKNPICLVRVRSDDGAEGWGQMAPYNADIAALVFHRQVVPHALGQEVSGTRDILPLVNYVLESEHKFPGSYNCRAVGGLDTALWDLFGKVAGKPVCELLGGKVQALNAYGSSMRRDIKPEDEAERLLRLKQEQGYGAFKIRVGKNLGHDQDEWPGRTEALLPAVRKAVGDKIKLLADGNSCYTPKRAIEVGKLMETQGYVHFEEPCPYWELDWTRQVREALDLDVAGGEQDWDMKHWEQMIGLSTYAAPNKVSGERRLRRTTARLSLNSRAVDIVQPDIGYIGGLARALEVARMAQEAGLPCVPHSANLSWITLFTMHMMAAIPNAGSYVESSIEPTPWAAFYEPLLKVENGRLKIPSGPGWGVEVDPLWLKKAERVESRA